MDVTMEAETAPSNQAHDSIRSLLATARQLIDQGNPPLYIKRINSCQKKVKQFRASRRTVAPGLLSAPTMPSTMSLREGLVGPGRISVDEINRTARLDNHGIGWLQRQILKG